MTDKERADLVDYRLERAEKTLAEIAILLENGFLNTAVNRLYYACFYAVNALLVSREIQAQTHSGVRQMFGLHFIKTALIDKDLGRFYSSIFDLRQTGDYDDFVDYTALEVEELVPPAVQLVSDIRALIDEV